jgi:hypothetical protein
MTKIVITIFIFGLIADADIAIGKFHKSGLDHYEIKLNADKTFDQKVGGCLCSYRAIGKWSRQGDTILLTAEKLYDTHAKRKKLQDTSSHLNKSFKLFNKLTISDKDTLNQLINRHGYFLVAKLPRVK